MRADNPIRHFVIAFVIALVGYSITYQLIEHRRTQNGPWEVAFTNDAAASPMIVVNQPKIGITNVGIVFPHESLTNKLFQMDFRRPRQVPYPTPIGRCVFMDTTFLPGTLTLQMYGHEIELLPRVLVIDLKDHPWRNDEVITLEPAPKDAPWLQTSGTNQSARR